VTRTILAEYLTQLARGLRRRGLVDPLLLEESRGHLEESVEAGKRRGLSEEAAEREAIRRFGPAKVVAASYGRDSFGAWNWILLGVAILMGIGIAYVDSRPHWDDAGVTAGSMLLLSGLLGLLRPERAWLWALALGVWIPLHGITREPSLRALAGGAAILAFPLAGAYTGKLFRWMLARG